MKRLAGYFILENPDGFGNVIALTSSWNSQKFPRAIRQHDAKIIRLSEYRGWSDADISFLAEIPSIEGVELVSRRVTDVRPIENLSRLKLLSLTCGAKSAFDFTSLRQLRRVFLAWRDVYESVFNFSRLVRINIMAYPEGDLIR